MDNDRLFTVVSFLNVDGDVTTDTTHTVITTINRGKDTTLDSQGDITLDVGLIRSAKHILDFTTLTAGRHGNIDVSCRQGFITISGTVQVYNAQGTVGTCRLLHIRTTNSSSGIATTKGLTDGSALQQDIGVMRHISTGISLIARTIVNFITTVTATKDITNFESTYDIDIAKGHRGCITATIDFIDADVRTSVDNHLRLLSEFCLAGVNIIICLIVFFWHVISEVTTAIDGLKLEFTLNVAIGTICALGTFDGNRYLTLRRTIQVVTSKHATMLGNIFHTTRDGLNIVCKGCSIDGDSNISINHGLQCTMFSIIARM